MARMKKGMAKKEKRSSSRWHLVFYLRILDGTDKRILGHVVNLSSQGAMLVSDAPFEVNRAYKLRVLLPKELSGRLEIMVEATCRWCRQDVNPDFYLGGFHFNHLTSELEEQIRQLVDDFSIERSLKSSVADPPACSLTHTTGK